VTGIQGIARRAKPSDLDAVLELDRVSPIGHKRTSLLTARVHSGEVLLFENEDQLLGFAVVRNRSFFGQDFVELLTVSVGKRRQGIGGYLLQEVVTQSSSDRIFTSTNQSNAEMIGLLENAGWHFSGQLKGIDEGDPELVFFKDAR
jgi:N-acetylglutamate synthase-like GNAT family acetyltransferase